MHNDHLDPDIHNLADHDDTETETVEFIDSICRVSIPDLRKDAKTAISFMDHNPELFAASWKDNFSYTPKGDFSWACEEGGDWVPSEDCDNEDGWTKNAYGMDISRKNGIEKIRFVSWDIDGDHDCSGDFTRKKGKRLSPCDLREFTQEMVGNHCYYILLKQALYSLHVAETGLDPLEDTIGNNDPRAVHAKNIGHEIPDLCASVYRAAINKLQGRKNRYLHS